MGSRCLPVPFWFSLAAGRQQLHGSTPVGCTWTTAAQPPARSAQHRRAQGGSTHVGELHDASVVHILAEKPAADALRVRKEGVVQQARTLSGLLGRSSAWAAAAGGVGKASAVGAVQVPFTGRPCIYRKGSHMSGGCYGLNWASCELPTTLPPAPPAGQLLRSSAPCKPRGRSLRLHPPGSSVDAGVVAASSASI